MSKKKRFNIRVQTCITSEVFVKLEEYQEKYGYDDMSSTLRSILEKHFGIE